MRYLTFYITLFVLIYLATLLCVYLLVYVGARPIGILTTLLVGALTMLLWLRRTVRTVRQERRIRRAQCSELAATLTPQLQGEYSPYVIEAAEKLGEARDVTAVPALLTALERCVEAQPPGWSERATALANALGRIGDHRALPLLYRLDNVRGIGLIPAVRSAIASIEPQSSLLRAGSAHDAPAQDLLRSVVQRPTTEEAAVLLRSIETD